MSEDKALTGGFTNYYLVKVEHPQREEQLPYQAECEDIIRALNMSFDEACEFKAIWRTAAARLGNGKPGQKALYDCEKRVHYAQASLRQERIAQGVEPKITKTYGTPHPHDPNCPWEKVISGNGTTAYPNGLTAGCEVKIYTNGGFVKSGKVADFDWLPNIGSRTITHFIRL